MVMKTTHVLVKLRQVACDAIWRIDFSLVLEVNELLLISDISRVVVATLF